jgi:hypothetical protein
MGLKLLLPLGLVLMQMPLLLPVPMREHLRLQVVVLRLTLVKQLVMLSKQLVVQQPMQLPLLALLLER